MAKRSLGIGYLIVGLAAGGLAGLYIFAPEIPRSWFTAPRAPEDLGTKPVVAGDLAANLEAKEHEAAMASVVHVRPPPKPVEKAVVSAAKPVDKPKTLLPDQESRAQTLLSEAQGYYQAMAWSKADSAANRVLSLNVAPATKVKAKDIIAGAQALAALFKHLDERDELTRNFETHPSLVTLGGNGNGPTYAVPILSVNNPVPVDTDPVQFINQTRKQGKVALLIRGKKDFIPTELKDIGTVEPVDQQVVKAQKQAEFIEKLKRLEGSSAARDALAWYEAGKYAYRNRLDEKVTEMLHKAVLIDPNLVRTVREDKAGSLYASLIAHLKNGNKAQAAAYMASIERKYKDTDQGKQARLYYDGNQAELVKAAKEAEARAAEEERKRKEALVARAKEIGDAAEVAKIEREVAEKPVEDDTANVVASITGDPTEAKADELFQKGYVIYAKAIEMGNSTERDRLYGEADVVFTQVVGIYSKLIEQAQKAKDVKKEEALQAKLREPAMLRFGCKKQRRFH